MTTKTKNGGTAIVLCGGRGSRMGEITETSPKALVEVHGKPILWYIFRELYRFGFRSFIFPTGYKGEQIEAYVSEISKDLACVLRCIDTGLDTSIAGRIDKVASLIPDGSDFFLLNSDTIFHFDIESMYQQHVRENALVTLSSAEVVSTWGLITIDANNSVCDFDRQRKVRYLIADNADEHRGMVNSGLAWINKEAIELVDLQSVSDFETAVFQNAIKLGRVSHFKIDGEWFPIDTPKDLRVMNAMEEDRHDSGHHAKLVHDRLSELDQGSMR